MKQRVVMASMVKRGTEERDFDREFWSKVGHKGRFAAAWEMIAEAELIRGKRVSQSRLQRSVQHILRRKG